MDKPWVAPLLALAVLSGCQRSTQLAVRAAAEGESGEVGRGQLEIRLIPYNRDSIFSNMAEMAPAPEPEPPADLLELRDSITVAQELWREAEATWNDARSELQTLSERMKGMNRSSNEYFAAYERFDELDALEARTSRDKDQYFERFTELQSRYTERADSFAAVLTTWEDETFQGYREIVDSLEEEIGRTELFDTTDAAGWALVSVPRGRWYVHTRFKLPFEELYWNVPYDSEGGADTLILNNSNAETRLVF